MSGPRAWRSRREIPPAEPASALAGVPAAVPDPQPTAPATARRLLVAALVTAVLAAAVFLLAVHTALGQRFDNAALLGSYGQRDQTRISELSLLRRITVTTSIIALAAIALLGIIRRRPRLGIATAVMAALVIGVTHILRTTILTRPRLVQSDSLYPFNTFPSGHTAVAFSVALALVIVSPPAWRGISAVVAGSYAWLTAVAVQSARWHRPSDAIGAALLTFAALCLVAALLAARRPVSVGRRYAHIPAFAVLGIVWVVAAILSTINAVRVLRFLVDHNDTFTPTQPILNAAYLCSVNLTVVVVVTLLATLLVLLGRVDLDQPGRR
ncbi:MAG TPA: phosphatase PAP2 family protein [Mycobacteriales bacterium]|nr:phosphatase PAP2 family protein [Mycobacteriales bacterium]